MAFLIAVIAAPAGSDRWFRSHATEEIVRRELPLSTVNSIKHAFAAACIYATFREAGASPETAALSVQRLGYANEWAEYYLWTFGERDSAREVYKDIWNNMAGIAAAAWWEGRGGEFRYGSLLNLVGEMTAQGGVLPSPGDTRIPDFPSSPEPNPGIAIASFKERQETIFLQLRTILARSGQQKRPLHQM